MRRYYLRARLPEGRHPLELGGDAHHYLSRVLRLRVGDCFDAVDADGQDCRAEVVRLGRESMLIEAWRLEGAPPRGLAPRLHLFQCLPKNQKMDIIVRQATEAGVATIVPVRSLRVVAEPSEARLDRWRRISVEALQQSGRREAPAILPPVNLRELARETGSETGGSCELFFHEDPAGSEPLHRILGRRPAAVRILVGPEGGLASEEVGFLREAGWRQGYLGPHVLRVDTAAVVSVGLASVLLLERDAWTEAP